MGLQPQLTLWYTVHCMLDGACTLRYVFFADSVHSEACWWALPLVMLVLFVLVLAAGAVELPAQLAAPSGRLGVAQQV